MENYVVYHLHSDLSNGVTNIDSVTKFEEYIDLATQYNMKALAFSEHGSVFEWVKKKLTIEKAGMKYIHAEEFYVTEAFYEEEKLRDNYHVVLIAKNYEGVKELNVLSSKAFEPDHRYYSPRISLDELMSVSDNIIITTACLGGILAKGNAVIQERFLKFLIEHKDNCYLEIQHHIDDAQKAYNQYLVRISEKYDIPLIAGTDTHCLNERHVIGRKVLQEAKNVRFENEDNWDLTFKSYDELVKAYELQNAIPKEKYLEAINNTNLMADRVEEFELDYSKKYPKLYENSFDVYKRKVLAGVKWRGVDRLPNYDEYKKRIKEETAAFVHNGAIDFMLLEEDYKSQMRKNNVPFGYSRGSCFTKNTLVLTNSGYKTIDNVKVGDKVISDDCMWHTVTNTMSYNVDEPLISIKYYKQGSSSKKYNNYCTIDHKYLINRNGIIDYIPACELKVGDLLCSPKIKNKATRNKREFIDLNDYNIFGYKFDDEYIYEEKGTNKEYKYSSHWFEKNGYKINSTFCKKIINGYRPTNEVSVELANKLLEITRFNSLDDYARYCQKHNKIITKIKRYIKNDMLFNCVIGMMYGDGWTVEDIGIGLAVNKKTKQINQKIFFKFIERLGIATSNIYINEASNRDLQQLYVNSKILNNYWKTEFFKSEKNKIKNFNSNLLNQSNKNLKGLLYGLKITDGSEKRKKISFDNTSLSLIGVYGILDNIVNTVMPCALDVRLEHQDKRNPNWINKESYKIRRASQNYRGKYTENQKYWFLPIEEINYIDKHKNTVYDLTIEGRHSYTVNNVIVHNCSGSVVAYLLGITEVDSVKYNLNFSRFMSTERVSLADIDTDWYSEDVHYVRDYLYNRKGLYCADIITFNTIQLKGAIDDVGRALKLPLDEVKQIKDMLVDDQITDEIRQKYPNLADYVDIVKGTIVSIGNHPSACIVSPYEVEPLMATFRSKTNPNPISQINMKEVDLQNYVKLDVLGLDAVGLISRACRFANIDYLTPDDLDFDDKNVWDSIRDDTTMIFQFESGYASDYLKSILKPSTISKIKAVNPNFRYIDLMSMANGAIRPAGASYRDQLAQGIYRDCGHPALNDFFAPTLGYLVYQCQIIGFLNKFCGYTMGEADIVRRHFAKKTGTESDIPIIRDGGYMNENHYIKGFIQTMYDDYGVEKEEAENLLTDILQVIVDASDYLFSQNHADPYSFIGFAIGYLRYYYPLETITAALNIYMADANKSAEIKKYATKVGIEIKPIKFGKSQAQYFFDKKENCIYQGIEAIKFCNAQIAQELYDLRNNVYDNFLDLYKDVTTKTSANSKQIEILVKLDYFNSYGKPMELLTMIDLYEKIANKKVFSKDKLSELGIPEYLMAKYSQKETAKQFREVDTVGLLQEMLSNIDYPKTRLVDRILWQKEYLGVITLSNPKLDSMYCFVEEIDKNRVRLYRLKDGKTLNVKVRAKAFKENEFKEMDIIKVREIVSEPKWINAGTKPDGKIDWQRSTTDYEDILKKWN